MLEPLRIRDIRLREGHFVDQPRLHIHARVFFVAVPKLVFSFAANTRFFVSRNLRQNIVVQLFVFFLNRLVTFLPEIRFRNQMTRIHKRKHFAHVARGLQLIPKMCEKISHQRRA